MAELARTRRGFAASSAALEQSASLTTDAARSASRLAAAVTDAFVSGEVDRARTLATRVLRARSPASARGEALHVLGLLEHHAGSVPAARDLLREAAELAAGSTRIWSLAELALVQHRLGDVPGMTDTAGGSPPSPGTAGRHTWRWPPG